VVAAGKGDEMLSFALFALLAVTPPPQTVDKARATPTSADDTLWYDLRETDIEGRGWDDTEHFYDRLPLRARGVVREPVWTIGQRSAGICARFMTDATAIKVRWKLRLERQGMPNMAAGGVSGMDLYVRDERGAWRWVGEAAPAQIETNTRDLVSGLHPGWHEFMLYLPLYNGVESVELGIPAAAALAKAPPRPEGHRQPVVVYGTSITEGGDASRPGMAYTAILGRRLDRPFINLGFSGNGPMETEVAHFLKELDPAVFVLDCLPNMNAAQVKERAVPFVKILREARPETPIVLVENITYQDGRLVPERRESAESKNAALKAAYKDLLATDMPKLFYMPGDGLLGYDGEATVDGTHPTDLGFMRMADAMEPVLRQALAAAPAQVASQTGPAPRFDPWNIIGPGGGGTMIAPTISPHDPRVVVEHCDMTGAYITLDGAQSWRMFNLRGVVETLAFDPKNPAVLYAGNQALWRSEDTGRTWSMIFPDPRKSTVEHENGDHADYELTTGDPGFPAGRVISEIAVEDSTHFWIAFAPARGSTTAALYRSADRGATWAREREFPGERILTMASEPDALLVVGERHVWRWAGGTWTSLAAVPEGITRASAGRANGKTVIYATSLKGAIHVSEDGGATWRVSQIPATGRFEAIAASAQNGRVAYAGYRGIPQGDAAGNSFNGIYKTTDGGRTWAIVHREGNQPSDNLVRSWIENRVTEGGHDVFHDAPWSLGVAPTDPNICYATDLFRTYRTTDGGKMWETVTSVKVGDAWTTRGLDVTTTYGVQFDPFDVRHMIIDYTDIGAFQSRDGGASWTSATHGVPNRWRNTTYWTVFDPQVKGRLWGAFSGVHDLPRPKMWRHRDPLTFVGGVGVSNDGGNSWQVSNTGMPSTSVTHLLLDPESPAGSRTLYACAFGRGVYKSTDDGKTWTLKNNGIDGDSPFAWRITRADNGTLYLVVSRRSDGDFGQPGDGALYRSRDGAEHWEKMALPETVTGPASLTLDPRDNRRMYLSAWGQGRASSVDIGGGIYLSTDAGAIWKPIFQESQHVYDVTVDPKHPDTIYACGFEAGAWRSDDAGANWTRLRGYTFKWGHRVVIDPVDPAKIYITTFGGSVWHGPARPAADVPEDITNPVPVAK